MRSHNWGRTFFVYMLKGYKARDTVTHRKTNLNALYRRFKTGKITYRGKGKLKGSGHAAGREWGERKGIDPNSRVKKYSKNSPSFDEGVWQHKQSAHEKALSSKSK